MENFEVIIMTLVVDSGDARSTAMEAIFAAKDKDFEKADRLMEEAEEKMGKAHKSQTELIQKEARGESVPINLLMVHAQDHIMNAMTIKDLAKEIIDLHKKIG